MCSVLLVGSVSVPPVFKPANTAAAAPPMGSPVAETAVASATAETSAVADATTPALATDTATPAPTASVLATATGTITDATTPPTLAVWAHNPVQTEQVSRHDGLAKLRLGHEGVDQV